MQERTQKMLDMVSLRGLIHGNKENKLELMNEIKNTILKDYRDKLDNITHYYSNILKLNSDDDGLLKNYRQGNLYSLAQNSEYAEECLTKLIELEHFFYLAKTENDVEDNYNYSLEIFLTELQNKIIEEYVCMGSSNQLDAMYDLYEFITRKLRNADEE